MRDGRIEHQARSRARTSAATSEGLTAVSLPPRRFSNRSLRNKRLP
jgi:hypothetical protein